MDIILPLFIYTSDPEDMAQLDTIPRTEKELKQVSVHCCTY